MPRTRSRGAPAGVEARQAERGEGSAPTPKRPRKQAAPPQDASGNPADGPPFETVRVADELLDCPALTLGVWPFPLQQGLVAPDVSEHLELRVDTQRPSDRTRLLSISAPMHGYSAQAPVPRALANDFLRQARKGVVLPRLQAAPDPQFVIVLVCDDKPTYKALAKSLVPLLHSTRNSPLFPTPATPRQLHAAWLYQLVARTPDDHQSMPCLSQEVSEKLNTTLRADPRPYQERALAWMLNRESNSTAPGHLRPSSENPFWRHIVPDPKAEPDGYFFHQLTGTVSRGHPTDRLPDPSDIAGGVLADEMGIGKTIELLSLILANPRPASPTSFSPIGEHRETPCLICNEFDHPFSDLRKCSECDQAEHPSCSGLTHSDDTLFCGECRKRQERGYRIQGRATLIVVPSTLLSQWQSEIERHINPAFCTWMVYTGIRESGYVSARALASSDIVLTSYETLRADLYRVQDPDGGRKLRFVKVHQTIPTPLVYVDWWRVCLDEAQMVETGNSAAAQFADLLSSTMRWAVSGTPVRSRVDELWGLLKFLKAEPLTESAVLDRGLLQPTERSHPGGVEESYLKQTLRAIMWRTHKQDILEELGIPKQSVRIEKLIFGPVESHFYKGQHEYCRASAMELLRRLGGKHRAVHQQTPLTSRNARKLLNRLVSLRQACCHPQIGVGGLRTLEKTAGQAMTMSQVLAALLQKAKIECEEALRVLCVARNAVAGLHLVSQPQNIPEAVELYRGNLALATRYEGRARLDKLQLLHTYHNLDEVLDWPSAAGVGRTMADASLREKYTKLRADLVMEAKLSRDQAIHDYQEAREEYEKGNTNAGRQTPWWDATLCSLLQSKDQTVAEELVSRVVARAEEARNVGRYKTVFQDVTDIPAIRTVVREQLELRESRRKSILGVIENLPGYREPRGQEEISLAGNCGKCRFEQNSSDVLCTHCKAQPEFDSYEQSLFYVRTRAVTGRRGTKNRSRREREVEGAQEGAGGVSMTSEVDTFLKDLQSICTRLSESPAALKKEAKAWSLSLERQKKEFRQLQALWRAEKDYLAKLDEVSMSVIRFSIREVAEPVTELEKIYRLLREEVPHLMIQWRSDEKDAEGDLARRNGQCIYLESLERKSTNAIGMDAEDTVESSCPMCTVELKGVDVTVFPCGHSYCFGCTAMLIERIPRCSESKRLLCPVCRASTVVSEISYVSAKTENAGTVKEGAECKTKETEVGEQNTKYGTKIGAVTKLIGDIANEEPGSKVLVFSQWNEMLHIVEESLRGTGIQSVTLSGAAKQRDANLSKFKQHPEVNVLLLPFRSGANGLNLTEAHHVVLLEPLLNPAAEQQAIGRVDRIGQKRETRVHRFIVAETIEERMVEVSAADWARRSREQPERPASAAVETIRLSHIATLFGHRLEN